MGKPRKLGMNKTYIPNDKADMRFRKKIYQHGREIADRDDFHEARREEREIERLKQMKEQASV